MFQLAMQKGNKRIVAKDPAAPYRGGRSRRWLKVKRRVEAEFVIGACTLGRHGVSSVLVGTYLANGDLHCVGEVQYGFSPTTRAALAHRLRRHARVR